MSQSRFVLKQFGSISINSDVLRISAGNLLIDNNIIGTSTGINYVTSGNELAGNFFGEDSISGGNLAFFADTMGSVLTNSNINIQTANSTIESYLGIGGTSGSFFMAPSFPNFFYLGDTTIQQACLVAPSTGNMISVNIPGGDIGINITSLNSPIVISCGNLICDASGNLTAGNLTVEKNTFKLMDTLTQNGSLTTTVTSSNLQAGTITTFNATLITQGSALFTVGNSLVTLNPFTPVLASITGYTGTSGLPSIYLQSFDGGFTVNVQNNSVTEAMNGELKIAYNILI